MGAQLLKMGHVDTAIAMGVQYHAYMRPFRCNTYNCVLRFGVRSMRTPAGPLFWLLTSWESLQRRGRTMKVC